MPRLASLRLAALGLALTAPTLATAGPPETYQDAPPAKRKPFFLRHKHVCPDCQLKAQMRADGLTSPPPTNIRGQDGVVTTGAPPNCLACQGAASAPVVMAGEAPGYANVGGGSAPGYSVAGNGIVPAEPAPVGVMQAGYQGGGAPAAGPGLSPSLGVTRAAAIPPAPMPPPTGRAPRPRVISTLLGLPDLGDFGETRRDRRRQLHAAIRYDEDEGKVNELPASMVYGRGAR